jgi:hydroxypyruvate isomerase
MPKLAANLTRLFNEVDFLDRFEAAARAGFTGVEYLFPYAYPKEQLAEKLAQHRLTQVLHNLPAGDWAGGERGIGCHPNRVGEFQDGVAKTIDYARALGCKQVNCLAGIVPKDSDPEKVRATFVSNLRFAADKLGAAGIKLLTEPINTFDIPGFWLSHTRVGPESSIDSAIKPSLLMHFAKSIHTPTWSSIRRMHVSRAVSHSSITAFRRPKSSPVC